MDPVFWIVAGAIALVVVFALIVLATWSNDRRKLAEAAELRRDVRQQERLLDRDHAVAREQEHRAGAAEQAARAKAAEAEKLRVEADSPRDSLDEQKRDVARMDKAADELDPRRRAPAGDGAVDAPSERHVEGGAHRDTHRGAEPLDDGPGPADPDTRRR